MKKYLVKLYWSVFKVFILSFLLFIVVNSVYYLSRYIDNAALAVQVRWLYCLLFAALAYIVYKAYNYTKTIYSENDTKKKL